MSFNRLQWLIGKRIDLERQGKLLSLAQAKEISMLTDGMDDDELLHIYLSAVENKLSDNGNARNKTISRR